MALTPAERDRIVSLRLDGLTVRAVAAETGHAVNTITKAWRTYMAENAEVTREDLETQRYVIVTRLETAAYEARQEGEKAREEGDRMAHVRYLREEREALRDIARLTGLDRVPPEVPTTQDLEGKQGQDHDARERLTERLQQYLKEWNAEQEAAQSGESVNPSPNWQ